LAQLNRRIVAEVVAFILHPKGTKPTPSGITLTSRRGWTELAARWRIVELWKLPAEELLATNEPGVMPWVPLAHSTDPPPEVLRKCRAVIDTVSAEDERWNLLAVTQVLARLRYNDSELFAILGGRRTMIESPLLQELEAEWKAEATAKAIVRVLEDRFGRISPVLREAIQSIRDESRLDRLLTSAVRCGDLSGFEAPPRS